MSALRVEVSRFVDEHQPGFVECTLIDVHGDRHVFVEKVPIVSVDSLSLHSIWPVELLVSCGRPGMTILGELSRVSPLSIRNCVVSAREKSASKCSCSRNLG